MSTPTPTDHTNAGTVRRFVAAIEAGDTPALEQLLVDDATWHLHGTLPVSGHYEGRRAILDEFLTQGLGLYRPGTLRLDITHLITDGDTVALEWHATGLSVRGNTYDNEYAFFFTVRNGKITAIREYTDMLHVAEALYDRTIA